MPIQTEPCTWPSTVSRLSALPQSCATQTLSTVDDAGLLVDRDLDHLRRIAVAHGAADGGAAILLAAVRVRDGGVVAGHRDGAGILERLGHDLLEGGALVLRAGAIELAQALDVLGPRFELARRRRDQHALEVLRRVDRRIADHEGHARGIGAVVLRHHLAVAGDDADAREIEAEHLGDASAPGWWTSPGRYRRRPRAPPPSRRSRA